MMFIMKKKELQDDDGTFNNFKLLDRIKTLDKMVRSCSFSNKLFLNLKDIETDLPVLYLKKYVFNYSNIHS